MTNRCVAMAAQLLAQNTARADAGRQLAFGQTSLSELKDLPTYDEWRQEIEAFAHSCQWAPWILDSAQQPVAPNNLQTRRHMTFAMLAPS